MVNPPKNTSTDLLIRKVTGVLGLLKAQIRKVEEAGLPVPPDLLQKRANLEKQIADYNQAKAATKNSQPTSKAMSKEKTANPAEGSGLRNLFGSSLWWLKTEVCKIDLFVSYEFCYLAR